MRAQKFYHNFKPKQTGPIFRPSHFERNQVFTVKNQVKRGLCHFTKVHVLLASRNWPLHINETERQTDLGVDFFLQTTLKNLFMHCLLRKCIRNELGLVAIPFHCQAGGPSVETFVLAQRPRRWHNFIRLGPGINQLRVRPTKVKSSNRRQLSLEHFHHFSSKVSRF